MSHSDPYLIVGRKDTGVQTRFSIEDLQDKQPKQFTLFILSYLVIQGRLNSGDFKSIGIPTLAAGFAEIASIHGLPYQSWIGDPRNAAERKSDFSSQDPKDTNPIPPRFGGYCTHGSVVFPTWHRVYMMAIEQAIGSVASSIADQIANLPSITQAEAREWSQAAGNLRFPFWDWAEERVADEGLPGVLYTPQVQVVVPGGHYTSIDNPLAWYEFKAIPDGFVNETDDTTGLTAYYAEWKRTLRYAASDPEATKSDIDALNKVLKDNAPDIRRKVALLFTYDDKADSAQAWDEFSNHTTESLRQMDYYNINSLEGIHDSMHDIIGGNGHMSDPDYAGFDPIFFLHHCNVDRLFALWEYVYPKYFLQDGYTFKNQTYPFTQARGTYWSVYNSQLQHSSELAPFRTVKDIYWTPDQARSLEAQAYPKFYTYPEIAAVEVDKPASTKERVAARKALQRYYGLTPKETADKLSATRPKIFNPPTGAVPEGLSRISKYRHVVAVVQTPEFAFNGPYSVNVYYIPDVAHPQTLTLIGSIGVFARQDHSACKGCIMRRDAGSTIRGVIPIPATIVDEIVQKSKLNLKSTTDEQLMAALKLHFRGTIVDKRGVQVGGAEGGPGGISSEEDALASNIVPAVTLASSAAAHRKDGTDGPVEWFDWKNHGEIFQGGHKAWKNAAVG